MSAKTELDKGVTTLVLNGWPRSYPWTARQRRQKVSNRQERKKQRHAKRWASAQLPTPKVKQPPQVVA